MTFNKYSLYCYAGACKTIDEVDSILQTINRMTNYSDVLNFITENYPSSKSSYNVYFEKVDKVLNIAKKENAIEICALKNNKLYFGKGWKIVEDKTEE